MREFLQSNGLDLVQHINEHLALVLVAMTLAIAIGIPLGVLLTRQPSLQRPVLGLANVLQTVPSLALFGFLLPVVGLGAPNAIIALVLYSLLPLIRNTVTGIQGVERSVREAAVAMGMTDRQILWQVELPLASSVILAGVRVATVLCVGVTTIASFIDAGGLGVYIQNGLRTVDNVTTLAGAIPAALLALCADGLLGALQTELEQKNFGGRPAASPRARALRRLSLAPLALALCLGFIGAVQGMSSLFGGGRGGAAVNNNDKSAGFLVVGSKEFTESRILAEIVAQMVEARRYEVQRRGGLGGNLPHQALLGGRIDCYPEYTGTAFAEILKHKPITDVRAVYNRVQEDYAQKFDVGVSEPLGYSNGFAILVRGADARRLKLKTISDAAPHTPKWVAGFGPDFITRADGYPGFARTYNLRFSRAPRSMDLSLINRALASGQVDLIAGNETDGLIQKLDLVQLQDDKKYFPPYEAVILARRDVLRRTPALRQALDALAGKISTEEMRRMNLAVDGDKRPIPDVVREWIKSEGFK